LSVYLFTKIPLVLAASNMIGLNAQLGYVQLVGKDALLEQLRSLATLLSGAAGVYGDLDQLCEQSGRALTHRASLGHTPYERLIAALCKQLAHTDFASAFRRYDAARAAAA